MKDAKPYLYLSCSDIAKAHFLTTLFYPPQKGVLVGILF